MENPDSLILSTVFSHEIWLAVLQHVDNITDYRHICDSSIFLSNTFQTLRTKVLFPGVIKILHKRDKDEPQALSTEDLVPFRRVCSSWKDGVDKILQHLENPYYSRHYPQFKHANDFAKYKEPFYGNPFLNRAVALTIVPLDDTSLHYSGLINMLRNFGHQIWYCYIEDNIQNTEEENTFFQRIRQILELMPNLHQLLFSSSYRFDDENLLPGDPFPRLNHLEEVKHYGLPALMFQKLAQRNPQITRVVCLQLTPEHLSVYLKEMPNLEDLSIVIKEIGHFNQIRDCDGIVCRLRRLSIDLQSLRISWYIVFSAVESKFGEALQDLSIDLPDSKFYTQGCRLNLSYLKNLSLSMDYPTNLDFILPMQHCLEQLDITCTKNKNSVPGPKDLVLNVYRGGETLHKSNIWKIFNRLKIVKVELHPDLIYESTRHSWKRQK